MIKGCFFLLALVCFISFVRAAESTKYPLVSSFEEDTLNQFAHRKNIPEQFRKPILKALSYFPELKNMRIDFVVKKKYTPLSTRPSFWSMIKRKNHRTYIISISNQTIDTLSHLLYQNLASTEQVGVMGHELSHVVDFNAKNLFQSMASGICHISKRFVDKMEYKTDLICIQHGLGKYLEAYSLHVRKTMHVNYWRGVDHVFEKDDHIERYMNPSTIEKYMQTATINPGGGK